MNKLVVLATSFISLFFVTASFGQQPSASPPVDDPVKITTSLIQLDAVVTGKDGAQVIDLKKEDFRVLQDGKVQQITSVVFVDPPGRRKTAGVKRDKNAIEAPMSGVRTEQGRLITFVLDDGNCLATVEGNFNMREAIKKFVDEQMQPDDRVAIYRTKGGTSLLQIYSSNKDVLRKKIGKLSLIAPGGCGSAFAPQGTAGNIPSSRSPIRNDPARDMYRRERDSQLLATIAVLNVVVERLSNVPQRKEIFLLSEGLAAESFSRSRDAIRELADKAARASVVVHTISNKGLTIPGLITAADGVGPGDTERISAQRIDEENALNGGLAYLAYTTGGKFVGNRAFLERDIERILDADKGYYLIAYEPDDETFKGKEFHKIEVKANRPDLATTSRKGFYGRSNNDSKPVFKTADSELFRAIGSPFLEDGIDLRLTTLYQNTAKDGNRIHAMFHLKGDDIQLTDEPAGMKKFVMDIVAVTLDEKAKVVNEFNHTYTMRIPPEGVATVLRNGLDFSTNVPIKRPGLYSFRIAVRDSSKRLGSAGDFVEVPDAKNGRLLLSDLIATTYGSDGKAIIPEDRSREQSFDVVRTNASPSVRQYRHGETLVFAYTIFNAKAQNNSASLTRQIRLFRDGKMLLDSGEKPIATDGRDYLSRIDDTGNIQISGQAAPGEYALQVIVRDKNVEEVSERSIDFEVIG
ncbi:MAG: VWA domain-containing protein [Pyrinomonadaceae bacterium]